MIQSTLLATRHIEIDGLSRISRQEVLFYAGFQKGCNILSVNLSAAEKRLKTHPWIRDIRLDREFPATIRIFIKEHRPLAVLDTHAKMMINTFGEIFKKRETNDPSFLPLIKGISMTGVAEARTVSDNPFHAVMDVLQLGKLPKSIIPNKLIEAIYADPDLGITLKMVPNDRFFQMQELMLGYGEYKEKYKRFKTLLQYLKTVAQHRDVKITTVDLNNPRHIVVKPMMEGALVEKKKEEA